MARKTTLRKTPTKSEPKMFLDAIRKGFFVWSWIGLLGAYTTASTLYGNQLFVFVFQGAKVFEFGGHTSVILVILLFPIMILIAGWLTFFQYSMALLDYAFDLNEDDHRDERHIRSYNWKLRLVFRNSIMFLILSWVFVLFSSFMPTMTRYLVY